ncbi:uncharacterized protein LOC129611964 [Condylostylus longicornis]|uniref:uncharacterized protein LOC129611964 n=1 Tax=Condylostylus longicornis TaxID=2530218 RepID=UPI00244DFB71|nr:uncharacterized protein LOC129611964 [Condylostylus longicornis]
MKLLISIVLLAIIPFSLQGESILKLDITPEEAEQYLAGLNLDVNYAPKTGENPLPATKNADGKFVYQGRVIDNPGDYVEEHYLAKQYHGQDGLGAYKYGYSDWNQGKAEEKERAGTVRGTYKYVNPYGRDFVATYWADHSGFHQEDNRPKVVPKPVTDSPAVRRAKEEHFRVWKEAAEAAGAPLSPNILKYYDPNAEPEQVNIPLPDGGDEGKYEEKVWWTPDPNEPTSEPKGFFYAFDYPVQLLRNIKEREELQLRAQTPIDEIDKRPEDDNNTK